MKHYMVEVIRLGKRWTPEAMVASSRFGEIWDELDEDERREVTSRMGELVAENPERLEPKVYDHLCNLFFSLALLDVEGSRGVPEKATVGRISSCMERYVQPQRRQMERLFSQRWLWGTLRLLIPRLMQQMSGANFQIDDVPGKDGDTIAFDCVRCPFKDLTARYGHPLLGPAFCHVDDVIYGHLPGVRFERRGTLARGDERCDFCFRRVASKTGMRVLVVGAGVIGSYLTHAACSAGNDVTLVARGSWAQTLRERGLVCHHWVQRTTTTDHPRVVESIPAQQHFDVCFSVMRQDQQMAALPQLAAIDANLLVLVGNDLRASEAQEYLEANGHARRVLFGFQSTAGNREGDHVEVVRWGATGLDVGPLRGEAGDADRKLLAQVFPGPYKPHWTHDFGDWLACHAAAVLPIVYVSYACGCDLHTATNDQINRMVTAQGEAYALLKDLGYQILPEGDETFFDGGPKTAFWHACLWIVAHTAIGTLCCDDHAKHAPDEMYALDCEFARIRARRPEFAMPAWDSLAREMGTWDDVLACWGKRES